MNLPGRYWQRLNDGRIQCEICPRLCKLHDGQRGLCFVRQALENQIFLGFAAETGNDNEIKEKGEKKRISKGCDLLMANPIDRDGQGFGEKMNSGFLLGPEDTVLQIPKTSKLDLAHQLLDALIDLKPKISQNN